MADNLPSFTTERVKGWYPQITISDSIIDGYVVDIDQQYGAALLAAYRDTRGSDLAAYAVASMILSMQGVSISKEIKSQSSPNGASVTYNTKEPKDYISEYDTQYILSDLTAPSFATITLNGGPTETQVAKGEFEGSNDVNLTNRSIIW